MLVLTRSAGETLVIGNEIRITVLEVKGDVVRIGVDAPRDVTVHRQEVFEELARSNRAAATAEPADLDSLLDGVEGEAQEPDA